MGHDACPAKTLYTHSLNILPFKDLVQFPIRIYSNYGHILHVKTRMLWLVLAT